MPEYPDIISIMPDQLRAGFLRCHDAGFIDTPRIESLADRGVHYSNAYTPHPPMRVPVWVSHDGYGSDQERRSRQGALSTVRLPKMRHQGLARDSQRRRLLHRAHDGGKKLGVGVRYAALLKQNPSFGREGWQRRYPQEGQNR
jgi:hypothetical protein